MLGNTPSKLWRILVPFCFKNIISNYQMLGKKVCNLWDFLRCRKYLHGHLTAVPRYQHNKTICLPALSSSTPLSPHGPSQPHQRRLANPDRDHDFTWSTRALLMGMAVFLRVRCFLTFLTTNGWHREVAKQPMREGFQVLVFTWNHSRAIMSSGM